MTQARKFVGATALAVALSTLGCGFPDLFTRGADSGTTGVDSNVPGVDSAVTDSGDGLDSATADSSTPTSFTPSNVDPVMLATASAMILGSFNAAFTAAGGLAGDEVVVNSDDGSVELFRAGASEGFIRIAGQGLVSGIFFDNQPQATGPVGAGVFVMNDLDVPMNVRVRGIGSDSLIFVATGCATIDGDLLVGGGEYLLSTGAPFDLEVDSNDITGGLNVPGPGGFAGGERSGGPAAEMGEGPGGGIGGDDPLGDDHGGGGGGGYGGDGGNGGDTTNNMNLGALGGERYYCGGTLGTTVCGGASDYNTALIPLVGGSGGGSGGEDADSGEGRSGGGAIQISALGTLCGVSVSGIIDAGGEGGDEAEDNNRAGGGGGSGGAILLEGATVTIIGTLSANGGGGGGGRGCGIDGDRGHLDAMPAPGGDAGPGCNGMPGGDGGAGTSLDGSPGVTDDRDPGGGGGAVGRIRINATTANVTGVASPSQGTDAYNEGPLP